MKHSPFTNLLSKVHVTPYREAVVHINEGLSPTPTMKKYEGNLPQNYKLLDTENSILAINGWLTPTGILYGCRWRQHKNICNALNMTNEAQMERGGYIKLTNMKWLIEDRYSSINLTQEQIATIKRWFEYNELSIDAFNQLKMNWLNK